MKIIEKLMEMVFAVMACVFILAVGLICFFLFVNGVPAIREIGVFDFLGGSIWKPGNDLYGIFPMILGSIYVTAGAILVGVPIGILTAVFLALYCPKWLYRYLKPGIELLAGIPSVVYGFFGLVVLVPLVRDLFPTGNGNSILTASLLLGMMILPTIIGLSESALRAVPEQYYEGALALGATKERSVFRVVLPAAKSGVLAGIVLGIGRAIGETMAVIMVKTEALSEMEEGVRLIDAGDLRISLIRPDGRVVFDSNANAVEMDDHSDRPEVREAMETGAGSAIRRSSTLKMNTFYYALQTESGSVLRVAKESGSILSIFASAIPVILLIVVALFSICMILAHYLTRSLVAPIEHMADHINQVSQKEIYRELLPVVKTIQEQHTAILKSARMRQEFTANVSHELKTPLTSISGYSELIESGMTSGEDTLRFAGEIHRSSKRLLTLINDILRLSELDSAGEELPKEEVELYTLAQSCTDMLQLSAERHQVTMRVAEGAGITVWANKSMMEEVVYNLCDNAIRYNNVGGTVTVSIYRTAEGTVLSVKDTGIGIPQEHQERIFERFYRVDKSRSKSTGGTGLGLAIVKHIVAQHGAVLQLESAVGAGTEMRVVFGQSLTT